jgi:hypothetical protein
MASSSVRFSLRMVSEIATTFSPGAKRADSVAQFDTTLVGATMRNGALSGAVCFAWQINASDCTVLPSPMSSARMPPSWASQRKASQRKPSCWYGRSRAPSVVGTSVSRSAPADNSPCTCRCHDSAWLCTTPSSASSSHSPAWKRLIRSESPDDVSCSARASSMSAASERSSGFSNEKYAPPASNRWVSPLFSARKTSANGTFRPSALMVIPRSNQSVSPASSPVDTPMDSVSLTSW